MKKIAYTSLFLVIISTASFGQPITASLPVNTAIVHYKLAVGYNVTTVLIFPAAVKQADRGEMDLLAQKQPGVENVLKVKAARRDFAPTNLHVFTIDGRVYAFDVNYASGPVQTTYDISKLEFIDKMEDNPKGRIELSSKPLDTATLIQKIDQIKAARPFFSTHFNKFRMKLQLQTIYQCTGLLFLGLKITNCSGLPYPVDFTKLYIIDKKRAKRSSVQQRYIMPLYIDTISVIPGKSTVKLVIVIPQLTIPQHRQLVYEVNEKNGSRHLKLKIRNRQLFKANELSMDNNP